MHKRLTYTHYLFLVIFYFGNNCSENFIIVVIIKRERVYLFVYVYFVYYKNSLRSIV